MGTGADGRREFTAASVAVRVETDGTTGYYLDTALFREDRPGDQESQHTDKGLRIARLRFPEAEGFYDHDCAVRPAEPFTDADV